MTIRKDRTFPFLIYNFLIIKVIKRNSNVLKIFIVIIIIIVLVGLLIQKDSF